MTTAVAATATAAAAAAARLVAAAVALAAPGPRPPAVVAATAVAATVATAAGVTATVIERRAVSCVTAEAATNRQGIVSYNHRVLSCARSRHHRRRNTFDASTLRINEHPPVPATPCRQKAVGTTENRKTNVPTPTATQGDISPMSSPTGGDDDTRRFIGCNGIGPEP